MGAKGTAIVYQRWPLFFLCSLAALMPDANGEIFLDRNPHIFSIVLDYLRSGWLDVPPEITTEYIEAELRHWQITGGLTHVCRLLFIFLLQVLTDFDGIMLVTHWFFCSLHRRYPQMCFA